MGQALSEPVTEKESACCQNQQYRVGSSCMQGWRINMEDSHTHLLSLPDDPGTAFFAVYDGHGGAKIAQYAGKHLHKYILQRPEYKEGSIPDAMRQGFLDVDTAMLEDEALKDEMAGTTAVAVIIKNNSLYCANVGDSRAIASVNGRVEPLSYDHKPSNYAFPDVEIKSVTPDWEFIVLACDGIWDVMTNEEVVGFIRMRIGSGMDPEDICEDLMTCCLAPDCQMGGLGCDNMTVVLVCFLHGKSYEELSARCSIIPEPLPDPDPDPDHASGTPELEFTSLNTSHF